MSLNRYQVQNECQWVSLCHNRITIPIRLREVKIRLTTDVPMTVWRRKPPQRISEIASLVKLVFSWQIGSIVDEISEIFYFFILSFSCHFKSFRHLAKPDFQMGKLILPPPPMYKVASVRPWSSTTFVDFSGYLYKIHQSTFECMSRNLLKKVLAWLGCYNLTAIERQHQV